MIVVIIAGGSGTRLWPLSTSGYPKHLLKLTNDYSLLQNTYNRVSELSDNVFVVSEASHIQYVYEQLSDTPKENILVEPARRGTASCVVLALSEIKRRNLEDQAILFLWADNLIRDEEGFQTSMKQAASIAEDEKKLVFIGIEPTYPSTGFGYMQKGERLPNGFKNAFALVRFVEKPDRSAAEEYLQSGAYFWNTGYLAGNLSVFEREMQENSERLWSDYQTLQNTDDITTSYMEFKPEAIEYALSEYVKDAIVMPGAFDWVDVGSFQDLHNVSHQDATGNTIQGKHIVTDTVTNTFVRNDSEINVAIIGLDNVAVVVNENGILVTNKTYAQKVGDVAKKIQS